MFDTYLHHRLVNSHAESWNVSSLACLSQYSVSVPRLMMITSRSFFGTESTYHHWHKSNSHVSISTVSMGEKPQETGLESIAGLLRQQRR